MTDHRKDISIYRMVLNRSQFIKNTPENEETISNYTLEIMYQLNYCFKIDEADIGNEDLYSINMRAIIADVICVYLLSTMSTNILAMNSINESEHLDIEKTKYIKTAKAGNVEVEYDQFDKSKNRVKIDTLLIKLEALINLYTSDAKTKAAAYGCTISLFDDKETEVLPSNKPFIVNPYG